MPDFSFFMAMPFSERILSRTGIEGGRRFATPMGEGREAQDLLAFNVFLRLQCVVSIQIVQQQSKKRLSGAAVIFRWFFLFSVVYSYRFDLLVYPGVFRFFKKVGAGGGD